MSRNVLPSSSRRPRSLAGVVVACLMTVGILGGCRDEPKVVFETARDHLKDKNVEDFLTLVTPKTRSFLERAGQVSKKSGRSFKVLRDAAPTSRLLPKGDVSDVVEQGRRCIVVVKKGRRIKQVPMLLVRGQWRIDLLEMDSFLAAIKPN